MSPPLAVNQPFNKLKGPWATSGQAASETFYKWAKRKKRFLTVQVVNPWFRTKYCTSSVKPIPTESCTCWKYLSQLMYSLSWESWSLLVFTYCQSAWMMQERVWVWMPSSRARRRSSLNWGGCGENTVPLQLQRRYRCESLKRVWSLPLTW